MHYTELVLLSLFHCMSVPTRYDFAARFGTLLNLSTREKSLVQFLLELSYLDYSLNYFLASRVAAGAIHLAVQVSRWLFIVSFALFIAILTSFVSFHIPFIR
jgi:hypothetical protein